MAQAIVDLTDVTLSLAETAATWLERFHPGVVINISHRSISLMSDAHDEVQLRRIWQASLLNEQLLEASSSRRRATLEALVR